MDLHDAARWVFNHEQGGSCHVTLQASQLGNRLPGCGFHPLQSRPMTWSSYSGL